MESRCYVYIYIIIYVYYIILYYVILYYIILFCAVLVLAVQVLAGRTKGMCLRPISRSVRGDMSRLTKRAFLRNSPT